jgi:subfamily B ATP-binding cassette protein MsbA
MFRLEDRIRERFQKQNNQYVGFLLKTAILEETSHPLVELVTAFAISAVIYYGGSQVLTGQMTSGDLIAFFTAFAMMMNPIRQLNDISIKLHTATAAADRIFNLLDWKSNMIESSSPKVLGTFQKGIGFERVKFAYPDSPEVEVLRGIGFEVPKGQTVAIVGASGAGKSSLVSLLPRLYDVTGGKITLDGIDLRDLKIEELRKNIAVVSQDVFLFNDSILENIRCGRLDATDEEVKLAAEKANAKDFIEAKPQGIHTMIGDRGQKLSGGERQRISIARAFLRDAPILILDEATSSLDSASERQVQSALEVLMQNKTTVVIAHRLSTIRTADRILVLKEGNIVEEGKHDELLARGGEFAHFYQMANPTATR